MTTLKASIFVLLACSAVSMHAGGEQIAYMTSATAGVQDSGRFYDVKVSLRQMEGGAVKKELGGIGISQKFGEAGVTSVKHGTGESLKLETFPVENEPNKVRCLVVFSDPEGKTTISEFIVSPQE